VICKSCENPIIKSEKYYRPPHGGYRHHDCMPAKMRRCIEVVQKENLRLIAEVDRGTGLCAAAAGRITRLESALREIRDHSHGNQGCLDPNCTGIRPTEGLEISNVCHTWQNVGRQEGHRCAAEIAREALKEKT
jgi:hypothetical protein